jgi:chromosome segregation ATPase
MGESASRYSIVERLTSMKLQIIGAIHEISDEVNKARQKHENALVAEEGKIKEFEAVRDDEIAAAKANCESRKRGLEAEIKEAEQKYDNLKDRKEEKESMLKEKLVAIDAALMKIEEISKVQNLQAQE